MPSHAPLLSRRAGFTLAEVMVALAIFTTAAFVLLQVHFSAVRLYTDSADESDRRMLLESTVSRAELGIMTGNMTASGDFGARWTDYGWSYQAQMIGPDNLVPLYQVTATLRAPDGEKSMDFFYFETGVNENTSNAELSGKSSIKSGAARGGMKGGKDGLGAAGGKSTGKSKGKTKKPSASSSSRSGSSGRSSSFGSSSFGSGSRSSSSSRSRSGGGMFSRGGS